jgi:anti-sigma factor RsiW
MDQDEHEHILEERLEAYALDALAPEEVATVEAHLLFCSTCQDHLDAIESYVRAMQGAATRIRREEIQAPAPTGSWRRIRAWLRTPAPIWVGAIAMASVILMVGLHLKDRPGATVDVDLQATRGASEVTAPAGRLLNLHLDTRGLADAPAGPIHIQVVHEDGRVVWTGSGVLSNAEMQAAMDKPLSPGSYFVRLVNANNSPVREYQLAVRKASP